MYRGDVEITAIHVYVIRGYPTTHNVKLVHAFLTYQKVSMLTTLFHLSPDPAIIINDNNGYKNTIHM